MMNFSKIMSALLALTVVLSGSAMAEVCVKVDEAKDSLAPAERNAAVGLLENGFRKAGETVVSGDCGAQYTVANIRLGQSITTTVTGPKGTRSLQVSKIEELGSAYEQIASSLITGATLGDTAGTSIGRNNVTAQQANPNRVENDSLGYAAVGPGYIFGVNPDEVPITIAGGYRYELDSIAIDLGGQLVIAGGEDSGGVSFLGTIGAVHFLDPVANNSAFVGGGLGLGTIAVGNDDQAFAGGGLHVKAMAGYEFFRASNMRLILQADVTLPLYDLEGETTFDANGNEVDGDSKYAPVVGLTVGGGFSKEKRSITVRHL
jgi:hypothetical protein